MKTKQEIQIELLQEIDEICSKNNLKYIFVGVNALNAYLNHTIKNIERTNIGRSREYPTEYDILSCLQKYEVGDFEDFMYEFGYEIKKRGDLKRITDIYNAVVKEYNDVCRCFTEEQLEAMWEIQ